MLRSLLKYSLVKRREYREVVCHSWPGRLKTVRKWIFHQCKQKASWRLAWGWSGRNEIYRDKHRLWCGHELMGKRRRNITINSQILLSGEQWCHEQKPEFWGTTDPREENEFAISRKYLREVQKDNSKKGVEVWIKIKTKILFTEKSSLQIWSFLCKADSSGFNHR